MARWMSRAVKGSLSPGQGVSHPLGTMAAVMFGKLRRRPLAEGETDPAEVYFDYDAASPMAPMPSRVRLNYGLESRLVVEWLKLDTLPVEKTEVVPGGQP